MKGFLIGIKNDLLEKKHVENMGNSVWLYMWCLDKMTSVSEEGIGKVLGGKPVIYPEIAFELGITERTYNRWIKTLKTRGYIQTIRAPYGLIILINKAVKKFKRSAKNVLRSDKNVARYDKNGGSNIRQYKDIYKDIGKLSQNELRTLVQ